MKLVLKTSHICIIVAITVSFALSQEYAFAQEPIEVKSSFSKKTATLEFFNGGNEPIKSFQFWLDNNSSFTSFRTESGWIGKTTSKESLVFTSDKSLYKGQSVKFEIKTSTKRTAINWEALEENNKQIQIGKESFKIHDTNAVKSVIEPAKPDTKPVQPKTKPSETGIIPNSSFKVIPKSFTANSTIRVIGKDFGAEHTLNLYLNDRKLHSFKTDKDGNFMFASKIPPNMTTGKVSFAIRDLQKNEILQEYFLKKPPVAKSIVTVKLEVSDFPRQIVRGEKFTVSGTALPSEQIFAKIIGPSNLTWSEKTIVSDNNGSWSFSFLTSSEFEIGQYSVMVSDSTEIISKTFHVVLAEQIKIKSLKPIFEPREVMIFNGTATPHKNLKVYLIDSKGNEASFIEANVSSNGLIRIEYPTGLTTPLDTYFLYLFAGNGSDVTSVGLGEYPKNIISSKMDKVNYQNRDTAIITIIGKPSETVDLTIIDSADKVKSKTKVKLGSDGKILYKIKMDDLFPGAYSAVVSKGNHRSSNNFTVGFKSGITWLDYSFTKTSFKGGELISFFGKTIPNAQLGILLIDPHDNIITKREFFSNHKGELLVDNLRIPPNGSDGDWILQIKSGLYSKNVHFQVKSEMNLFSIQISDIHDSSDNAFVIIDGKNASPENIVKITIKNNHTEKTWDLTVKPEKDGKFSILWILPDDAGKGSYLVTAQDGSSRISQQTFEI